MPLALTCRNGLVAPPHAPVESVPNNTQYKNLTLQQTTMRLDHEVFPRDVGSRKKERKIYFFHILETILVL